MDIKSYLSDKRLVVEQTLESIMLQPQGLLADHIEAMRYSLLAGGKRIRPILCLATVEAFGGSQEAALPFCCALECIHTYSLIHDDLPAMDNDDLRRGKPTNHKVFGEAAAILAGDGLLTFAFEVMSLKEPDNGVSPQDRLRIIRIVAQAAGSQGMVGGQALDVACEGKKVSMETLFAIHQYKTGALITASIQTGAVIGGADQDAYAALTEYGRHLGITFQIVDDILNVESTPEQLGKSVGSDALREKNTYPGFLGVEGSWARARESTAAALNALSPFDARAEPLRELAQYVLLRKK